MRSPTLFLDRDGVINCKMPDGDYVKKLDEFEFIDGALEALRLLARRFTKIIVTTNQQGVAKGLLSEYVLKTIHHVMLNDISRSGGRVDGIYYCPHMENTCDCRKPQIGMALQAQKDFPDIVLTKAYVIGDTDADWEFGKNIGGYPFLLNENFTLLDFANKMERAHE